MKRRTVMQAGLGLGWALVQSTGGQRSEAHPVPDASHDVPAPEGLTWKSCSFIGLGTVLSIKAAHRHPSTLEQALERARRRVDEIEDQMSLFRPRSQLAQLNAQGHLDRPGPDLLAVLERSRHFSRLSDGGFDVTVQPLWSLYEQCQRAGRLPLESEVAQARAHVGWQGVDVHPDRIAFARAGMAVTLNGIAQGYATDEVKAVLQRCGIKHALVNMGEWSALGRPAPTRPWVLGVADPRGHDTLLSRLAVRNASVATSSDQLTTFSEDHRHHHIFDPHTGHSPTDLSSVTVVAPDCVTADAMTKVLFVAGLARALDLAARHGVQALLVDKKGQTHQTPGLPVA